MHERLWNAAFAVCSECVLFHLQAGADPARVHGANKGSKAKYSCWEAALYRRDGWQKDPHLYALLGDVTLYLSLL